MRQALHIFRKDVRGLAYEIVVALLLVAVFAMADSRPYFASGPQFSTAVTLWWTGFLRPLMLLSWWFLAAKVVQAEAIPGDRQFWITRPYSWKSLLAAKVAFLVAFISIPMMISDAVILHGQGFPVLANASGILWEMLLRFSVIVLSSMIVASLTRSLGSFTIVSLVVALAIVFNAGFQAGLGADRWADWTFAAIGEALIPTAIVFQYSRRRKIAVVLAVCAWILPIAVADIERHFWHPMPVVKSSGPELKFKLNSRPARAFTELSPSEVRVVLPIEILGIPKDLRPWSNAMSVTLVSPSSEVWMSSNNVFLLPGSDLKSFWVEIRVPKIFTTGQRSKEETWRSTCFPISLYTGIFTRRRFATVSLPFRNLGTAKRSLGRHRGARGCCSAGLRWDVQPRLSSILLIMTMRPEGF